MVNLNEEVYGQHKKDAHLTADMGSHLFSLFQALLPEQFDLSFIINICTAIKIKQMLFSSSPPWTICTAVKICCNNLHCR